MGQLFHTALYLPLLNLLVFFYNVIPGRDIGVAIIILTVLLRLLVWPLAKQSIVAQKQMSGLQPKLNALKEQYKNDKQALAAATMKLYKDEKMNPLSSCVPLLIQLPLLIVFYWVLRDVLNSKNLNELYPFVANPGSIKVLAFGFLDLLKPNYVLAVLAGGAQFWQAKMLPMARPIVKTEGSKDEDMTAMMNKQMVYMMPLMTVVIGFSLPGGLSLYWLITTLMTVFQQKIILRGTSAVSTTASPS
ncbi:MAG: membrane protein insertase YidC [Candidatus Magasanikbacteria bacterium]|nr:membrane protein insertase YidC [Candidatus Magasanikbacteria bacterium]